MEGIGGFASWLIGQGYAARTRTQYLGEITRLHRWAGDIDATTRPLSPQALASYAATRPNTWSTRHLIVGSVRAWTRYTGCPDPTGSVPRGPQPKMRCRALEEGDAASLSDALTMAPLAERAAGMLMLYQAMRRQEVAALEWKHVEVYSFREIRILGKAQSDNVLPLHPLVAQALRELREVTPGPWVFPGDRGHVTGHTVYWWTLRIAQSAGVGHVSPHQLRHTALTYALERTQDLRAVQAWARHARPETTAGYTRASRRRLAKVMQSLDYSPTTQMTLFET